jgi:hypothetical protein
MRAPRPGLLLCLGLLASRVAAGDVDVPGDRRLKASFLYNVTKFVEWPAASFSGDKEPIVIGVLGDSPLASELGLAISDRKVNGHSFVVRNVVTADDARQVHVLFVEAGQEGLLPALRPAIQDQPILTVGENPGFGRAGGTITIARAGDKLRFEINMRAADRAHLKVSSQLQKLATAVTRSP